jgi:ketosteroid isomerase-like protein/uncharacterized protein (DUF433 family)
MTDPTKVIHSDPGILGGTPVFVGTRVPLQNLIDCLKAGDDVDQFLASFPSVTREQAVAPLELARVALEGDAGGNKTMTGVAVEDVVCAIRAMDREFMDNVVAKNAARLVDALYADDACILMPGRPAIRGKPAVLDFWKAALDGPVEAITLDTTHIEVSGDLAYGVGNNTITLKAAGGARKEEKGKYVAVYRRQPVGDWKLVVDSYSNDV